MPFSFWSLLRVHHRGRRWQQSWLVDERGIRPLGLTIIRAWWLQHPLFTDMAGSTFLAHSFPQSAAFKKLSVTPFLLYICFKLGVMDPLSIHSFEILMSTCVHLFYGEMCLNWYRKTVMSRLRDKPRELNREGMGVPLSWGVPETSTQMPCTFPMGFRLLSVILGLVFVHF